MDVKRTLKEANIAYQTSNNEIVIWCPFCRKMAGDNRQPTFHINSETGKGQCNTEKCYEACSLDVLIEKLEVPKKEPKKAMQKAENSQKDTPDKPVFSPGMVTNHLLVEMLFNPENGHTAYAVFDRKDRTLKTVPSISIGGREYVPYRGNNDLVKHRTVKFPSDIGEKLETAAVLRKIKEFVEKYVTLSPLFRELVPYYVLMTWVYDRFTVVPYLRAIGDKGTGKSRFLIVAGSLTYRSIWASGATTSAPIFRTIDRYRGSLVIDEADFEKSDAKADISKILNSGFMAGSPILRCVGDQNEPTAFHVFGPKILAARESYRDDAIESRCFTEDMDSIERTEDIPINLPTSLENEALEIRNILLRWRFEFFDSIKARDDLHDPMVADRLNQISAPIKSLILEENIQERIKTLVRAYHAQLIDDKSFTYCADMLIICDEFLRGDHSGEEPTMKNIAQKFNERTTATEVLTSLKVGSLIRKVLKLDTGRTRVGYVLFDTEKNRERIKKLKPKYGIAEE